MHSDILKKFRNNETTNEQENSSNVTKPKRCKMLCIAPPQHPVLSTLELGSVTPNLLKSYEVSSPPGSYMIPSTSDAAQSPSLHDAQIGLGGRSAIGLLENSGELQIL